MGAVLSSVDSNDHLFEQRSQEFFSITIGGGCCAPDLL
jgi:hypothetical protein